MLHSAMRIAGNPATAGDDVQEVFLRIAHTVCDARPTNFAAWTRRMLHNVAVDRLRADARRRECSLDDPDIAARAAMVTVVDPEAWAEVRGDLEALRAAADRMPAHYRHALRLAHVAGCDAAGVAARLGLSAAAAHKLLARAGERLRLEYGRIMRAN